MISWSSKKDGIYVDIVSDDGHWWIAQGFDLFEAKRGRPFLLMHCATPEKGKPWRRIDGFKSVREAKHFAEEMSE